MPDLSTYTVANVTRGHPWHRLGHHVTHDMSIDEALHVAGCDDTVTLDTLYVYDPVDGYVPVDRWRAVKSSQFGVMWVSSPKYEITQRRRILELAYEIVGLDRDANHIDTLGSVGDAGEKFFAYLRCPDLVIDPNGIADTIEKGLFVATSFDGTMKNVLGYSTIRIDCMNKMRVAMASAPQLLAVRHTLNSEERLMEAATAHGYLGAVEKEMTEKAERMLRVDGNKALRAIQDHFWPLHDTLAEKSKSRRTANRDMVEALYSGPGNVSLNKLGPTGYAAYQAMVEYLDFHRDGVKHTKGKTQAQVYGMYAEAAVMPGVVADKKLKAADIVLGLA